MARLFNLEVIDINFVAAKIIFLYNRIMKLKIKQEIEYWLNKYISESHRPKGRCFLVGFNT